jgi:hypothetical protein
MIPQRKLVDSEPVEKLLMTPETPAATSLRGCLLSPDELAQNLELSPATLATWRCQRTGPPFVKVGRKIWYPKDRVRAWMETNLHGGGEAAEEEENDGAARKEWEVVLPISTRRTQLLRDRKFGRHQTKRERGAADRSGAPHRTP